VFVKAEDILSSFCFVYWYAHTHTHTHVQYSMQVTKQVEMVVMSVDSDMQCGALLSLFLLKLSFHNWNTCQFHR